MGIPGATNPLLLASQGGYQVSRSLRFNSSDSAYLSRTPSTAGNRKTWTWAGWVKRAVVGQQALFHAGSSNQTVLWFDGNVLEWTYYTTGYNARLTTTAVYRDFSAWMHVVFALDTTQATANNRMRLYVNGEEVTTFTNRTNPALNDEYNVNNTVAHQIGYNGVANGYYFNGYLADIHFIDGQALTPSSFTEVSATTGQLIPKAYTGTFGTNGFWLKFSDNSNNTAATLGKDYSPNGNNWTPNNLSVTAGAGNDSLVDTPTSYGTDTGAGGEVRGNYCTWNPLSLLASATTSNGNLDASTPTANGGGVFGTIAFPASGKWYFEVTPTTGNSAMIGISDYLSTSSSAWAISPSVFYWNNGKKYVNGSDGGAYGATYAANDVIGVAVNCDSGSITFYKNNSSQGSISCSPGGLYPCLTDGTGATADSFSANFGQRPFAYTAPSGFKALCDTNLPAPVVAKPNTVMDVLLWSGTGGNRSFSSLNMSPDFVWIKQRNAAFSTGHQLYDSVRGAGSEKELNSSGTGAEGAGNIDQYGWLSSFDSNGFSVTVGPSGADYVNASGFNYVAWAWDAGTSTVTNTQGSITSSVRANASAGFSVVSWSCLATAGTIGHGLGVAPSLILMKDRSATSAWFVYHKDVGTGKYLQLQSTAATTTNSIVFSTAPTSTVFDPGTAFVTGGGYTATIAYCFAPVAGYSSAFSFSGNGSSDGPMVWLGFRPRFILLKRTDTTGAWTMRDTARDTYNISQYELLANSSAAESSGSNHMDILSNGFKLRSTDTYYNASGGTYVGFAWAESPFQYARAR